MTREEFDAECAPMIGRAVLLYSMDVGRFDSTAEDDCDFYYVITRMNGKVEWYSAVGHCEPLDEIGPAALDRVLSHIALQEK